MRRRSILGSIIAAGGLAGCGRTIAPIGRETTGLDPNAVARTFDAAAALPRLRAVIVARDGAVLAERLFRGPSMETPTNIKSASKSVLAAITGAALYRRLIENVETPIATALRDRFPSPADPRLERITIENLLTMQAGLASTSGANYGAWVSSRDWVRYALAQPFETDPGQGMIYSTGTSHLLSATLTRMTDRSTLRLARDLLGEPLEIEIPGWPADPQGVYFGGNDMRLSPRAMTAIGELYRNDGVHNGVRVLPENWVQTSWRGRGRSRWSGNPYGYGWWLRRSGGREINFAWGYGGQMIFVVPALRLTVVMTSDPEPTATRDGHVDALHRLLDEGFIPAAETGAPDAA
jgi:CubicO group peptidase (beta-lactamase class C family)